MRNRFDELGRRFGRIRAALSDSADFMWASDFNHGVQAADYGARFAAEDSRRYTLAHADMYGSRRARTSDKAIRRLRSWIFGSAFSRRNVGRITRESARRHRDALGKSQAATSITKMSIEQIKEAIEQLSLEQRAELAAWLHGWKSDEWGEQMKRDVAAGRFDAVIREIDEDIRAGRLSEMP